MARECQRLLAATEARRQAWKGESLKDSGRNQFCQQPDLGLLVSKIMKEYASVVFKSTSLW
jgi:hypothetical protein